MKQKILVIAHNIRSAHNVGALFRTSDGFGVEEIILSGYTPQPAMKNAFYIPKFQKEIKKTALGAEEVVSWEYKKALREVLSNVRSRGYRIVALEQNEKSISFAHQTLREIPKIAIVLGNEVRGVHPAILKQCDHIAEIPMQGKKESLNVSVSCGAFLAMLRYGK